MRQRFIHANPLFGKRRVSKVGYFLFGLVPCSRCNASSNRSIVGVTLFSPDWNRCNWRSLPPERASWRIVSKGENAKR